MVALLALDHVEQHRLPVELFFGGRGTADNACMDGVGVSFLLLGWRRPLHTSRFLSWRAEVRAVNAVGQSSPVALVGGGGAEGGVGVVARILPSLASCRRSRAK